MAILPESPGVFIKPFSWSMLSDIFVPYFIIALLTFK